MLASTAMLCCAQTGEIGIDTGECGGTPEAKITKSKSALFSDGKSGVRVYGLVEYRYNLEDARKHTCHTVVHLFVSLRGKPFRDIKSKEWDTEPGQIVGVGVIGLSPTGTMLAADFWLAEGDGVVHTPLVHEFATGISLLKELDTDAMKSKGCDQVEDFIGVTDEGEAIFAVPPSEYVDPPACGDNGVWHFNLKTGAVKQVAKISGDKWR